MTATPDAVFQSIPEKKCDPLAFYSIAPRDSRIAIYGAGKAGELFHDFIRRFRSDIRVTCYIDSFREGSKDGLPVLKVDRLPQDRDFDYIVICSAMYREIEGILKFFGEHRHIVVSQKPKYSSRYFARNKEHFDSVAKMLHSDADRSLYQLLLDYSRSVELMLSRPDAFVEKLKGIKNDNWYLDFINADAVGVVVDAGAYDGDTARHFLKNFRNLNAMHCFDISFSKEEFFKMNAPLLGDGRVHFHEQGLSDKKEVQHIIENSYQSHAAGISISRDAVHNREVPCTSLDIFAREQGIMRVDYIKMDIEGAELEALHGCREVIRRSRPQLAICIYHEFDDMWSVPLYLKSLCDDYVFRLSHYSPYLTETVIFAVPRELYQGE